MSAIFVTIAICTWNRSESLRETLASLRDMESAGDIDWEVLVVNNNCTDDTEEVVASFAGLLPIRSVTETKQGHSNARNRAVEASHGNYILWTDDDVIVGTRWLAAYADAFRAWPETAVFGGPIFPHFVGAPPNWLSLAMRRDDIACAYALRDLGAESIALKPTGNDIPFGANFAIRMKEQRQCSFDPRLGLHKSGNVRGEETDVMRKILRGGASGRWVPNAPVRHVIPKQRQTEAYVRDYFVGEGRCGVRSNPLDSSPSIMGVPRWMWRAAITSHARYAFARLFCSPGIWCRELREASISWGKCLERWDGDRFDKLSDEANAEAR